MTPDARDELIQRHLDGTTTAEEVAQVTRLLAEDVSFRSRFFNFVNQVARLRETLGAGRASSQPVPTAAKGRFPAVVAVMNRPRQQVGEVPESLGSRFDYRHIYFNAVLGGLGGLAGWAVFALFHSLAWFAGLNTYLRFTVVGPLLGICIGFAIGSTEGLIASRSPRRVLRGGGYGAVLGALGGCVGLLLGEFFFQLFGAGVWPRAMGWAIFGAFVGTSDGFAQKMPAKIRYGILGGILGGLIGGSTFQGLQNLTQMADNYAAANAWGSAIGLIILGASIGALVALVESILRKAWLRFTSGRLEGQTRTLDSSRPHTIGSCPLICTIVIPEDPTIAPVHAEIRFNRQEQFEVFARDGKVIVRRDGRDFPIISHVLQPGDSIRVGESRMIFRNEEGKQS